jgi:NitT/TauT family transport system substrate-binding protein
MQHSRTRFLSLAAAPLVAGVPLAARSQSAEVLRVGTTPNDSYAEPFYAQDEGFFQRAGLNVEVHPFPNGAGVTTALAGNAIDVGITNPISLANAVEHGIEFAFFAAAALYNRNELALCVAQNAPIHDAKDLDGKTVGVTAIKDANSLHIVAWMDRNGGDSSTVQLVEMPFSAMAPAVLRGTVAAAPIAEPALTTALATGQIRELAHPMDVYGKHFMIGGYFARRDWIVANRPVLRKFVDAVYATARWANAHPLESSAILAKYSRAKPEVLEHMNRAPYGDAFGPQLFQPYLDIGYKYKYIGKHFNASDLMVRV